MPLGVDPFIDGRGECGWVVTVHVVTQARHRPHHVPLLGKASSEFRSHGTIELGAQYERWTGGA